MYGPPEGYDEPHDANPPADPPPKQALPPPPGDLPPPPPPDHSPPSPPQNGAPPSPPPDHSPPSPPQNGAPPSPPQNGAPPSPPQNGAQFPGGGESPPYVPSPYDPQFAPGDRGQFPRTGPTQFPPGGPGGLVGPGGPGGPPPGLNLRRANWPVDPLGRPMATWGKRAAAILIDLVLLFVPTYVITTVVTRGAATPTGTIGSQNIPSQYWVSFGLSFVVVLGYFAFCDGNRRGQTVGKLALGIAVRDLASGGPIGAGRAFARRLFFFGLYFLFILPFFINILWPLWDPRKQGLHDKIVNSCVVDIR